MLPADWLTIWHHSAYTVVMGRPKTNQIWFIDREQLARLVGSSKNFTDVLRSLGLGCDGDNVRRLKQRLAFEQIEFSHFARGAKVRGQESKFHSAIASAEFTRDQKKQIAEAAALFRLAVHGFQTFKPTSDSSKEDWLVVDRGRLLRIQVRWAGKKKEDGLPKASLVCHDYGVEGGTRRFRPGEFDFLVAYDYYSDTAYVFSESDVAHAKRYVTIRLDAAERWDKLRA